MHTMTPFGWLHIMRLGLVQACLGSVVVVTTSTLNRIMVVELALPALLPGLLVGWHYGVQMVRPRLGFGADEGRRSTPWMLGGVLVLALGGILASMATVWMASELWAGMALAFVAFCLIGLGVSACGTSLLALMAKRVPSHMRAPAATLVWMMMIVGFAVTAVTVGKLIDPYTPLVLIQVTTGLACTVVLVAALSLWGLEGPVALPTSSPFPNSPNSAQKQPSGQRFKQVLKEVWSEPQARIFTIFVFLSMLAYSSQDLILEPFAGSVFGMSPGATTQLSGLHHSGVLAGMIWVAIAGSAWAKGRLGSVPSWMVWGCLISAVAMSGLSLGGLQGQSWPLKANVFVLGVANGAFSIAAIATMMRLAGKGQGGREGTRMGLWGASQAIAFGLGGVLGTAASDLARWLIASPSLAYATVFGLEALMFALSAAVAVHVFRLDGVSPTGPSTTPDSVYNTYQGAQQ